MACTICGVNCHNARTCPTANICPGCDEPVAETFDFNGQHWHGSCFEVSDGPTCCCGIIYEEMVTIRASVAAIHPDLI